MAKNKYYVVWKGHVPGIYKTWDECKSMVDGFQGARYKGFESITEAQEAFKKGASASFSPQTSAAKAKRQVGNYIRESLSVDAACSGNPGVMEYRGVYVAKGEEWFHQKFELGTNNIGEFLALVHGLAELKKRGLSIPIYTDSRIALSWYQQKSCKTKLELNSNTQKLFQLIERAEYLLKNYQWTTPVLKWETKVWGEIPADFGRK
jgi:ribonuclease HI